MFRIGEGDVAPQAAAAIGRLEAPAGRIPAAAGMRPAG